MYATLPLLLAPGLGGFAIVADLVLTAAALAVTIVLVARARRAQPTVVASGDVVTEAEAIVSGASDRQPA